MFRVEMPCNGTRVCRLIELMAGVHAYRERFQAPCAVAPHEGDHNTTVQPTGKKCSQRYVADQVATHTAVQFGAQIALKLIRMLDWERHSLSRPVALDAQSP